MKNTDYKKRRRKLDKFGVIYLGSITAFILLLTLVLTRNKYVFGSLIDWISQHSVLPEYYRQHFYETRELIPKFNMNLGAGQNAYNISYYGLLNPVIILSFAFPFIKVYNYVVIAGLVLLLMGIYLCYYWLRNIHVRQDIAAIATAMFGFASPLFYHTHRQIMFVWYMPFLIMAFIGVDRFFRKKRRDLLIISVVLIILVSYYYSIGSIIAITVYAIYRFLERNEFYNKEFKWSDFFAVGLRYAVCIINAIIITTILLLPTFLAIIGGREQNTGQGGISVFTFIPDFSFGVMLYDPYGLGLIAISIVAVVYVLLQKEISKRYLGICMLVIAMFPFFRFVLNLGLYTRAKVLFPFIPIFIYAITIFLQDLLRNRVDLKKIVKIFKVLLPIYLVWNIIKLDFTLPVFIVDFLILSYALYRYYKTKKKKLLYLELIIASAMVCICGYFGETFMRVDFMNSMWDEERAKDVKYIISQDNTFYRMNNFEENRYSCNLVYDARYYQTSMYSSVYNKDYNIFVHDTIKLSNPTVNKISVINGNNILFQTFMGVKYVIAKSVCAPVGYERLDTSTGTIYKNDKVYSLGFATPNVMSYECYEKLDAIDKQAALLEYVVLDKEHKYDSTDKESSLDKEVVKKYQTMFHDVDLKFDFFEKNKKNGKYYMDVKETSFYNVDLSKYDYDIYAIEINLEKVEKKRVDIIINGERNALSGENAAFVNNNLDFLYMLSSSKGMDKLKFELRNGRYVVVDYKVKGLYYSDVLKCAQRLDMMYDVTIENSGISGKIDVKEDGYFNLTVPYDSAFEIYVDGKKVKYEKTDDVFIGFEIGKGTHILSFCYEVPGYDVAKKITISGLVIYFVIIVLDEFYAVKRKKASKTGKNDKNGENGK